MHASAKPQNSVDIGGRIRTLSADAPFIMHTEIKGALLYVRGVVLHG